MYRVPLFFITFIFVFTVSTALAQETSYPLVELKNQYSGKCLAVMSGSAAHGAKLMHNECGIGGPHAIWEMRPETGGYRIANKSSGLCLGVRHKSKKNGAVVTQVSPCDRPDTLWKIEYMSPDLPSGLNYGKPMVLRNNNSNKCLALVTGRDIKQYKCPPHRAKTTWQLGEAVVSPALEKPSGPGMPDVKNLIPFYHSTGTYLFGLFPDYHSKMTVFSPNTIVPGDNAAYWWRINDDPGTGFTRYKKGAKMSPEYEGVTSFQLNNATYIFGIHKTGPKAWRINAQPETGFTPVAVEGAMQKSASKKYNRNIASFQVKGKPHVVAIHADVGGSVWRVKEDGPNKMKFELQHYKAIKGSGQNYEHLGVFYRGEEPYVFGVHGGLNIWRVKEQGGKTFLHLVMKGGKLPSSYNHVLPFRIGDTAYLLGLVSEDYAKDWAMQYTDTVAQYPEGGAYAHLASTVFEILVEIGSVGWVEWGKGYGCIWEISGPADQPAIKKISNKIPISHRYGEMTTFEQAGKTYLFGIHAEGYANIWQINEKPETGFSVVYYGRNK